MMTDGSAEPVSGGAGRGCGVLREYVCPARDQMFLLPVSMREWIPEGHLAWFVLDVVAEIDTRALHRRPVGAVGRRPYEPEMMLALILYGYCCGVRFSRRLEAACRTDAAFRVICGGLEPDHATIARFVVDHERALEGLFVEGLRLCDAAGLIDLSVVALDGTKIAADASLARNRSGEWIRREVAKLDLREQARGIQRFVFVAVLALFEHGSGRPHICRHFVASQAGSGAGHAGSRAERCLFGVVLTRAASRRSRFPVVTGRWRRRQIESVAGRAVALGGRCGAGCAGAGEGRSRPVVRSGIRAPRPRSQPSQRSRGVLLVSRRFRPLDFVYGLQHGVVGDLDDLMLLLVDRSQDRARRVWDGASEDRAVDDLVGGGQREQPVRQPGDPAVIRPGFDSDVSRTTSRGAAGSPPTGRGATPRTCRRGLPRGRVDRSGHGAGGAQRRGALLVLEASVDLPLSPRAWCEIAQLHLPHRGLHEPLLRGGRELRAVRRDCLDDVVDATAVVC